MNLIPPGPCAKQTVYAMVVKGDSVITIGSNICLNPQSICQREVKGCKTGEGYEWCTEVCQQLGHAEAVAIQNAGCQTHGATMVITGHTYSCDDCKEAMQQAGIDKVIFI